MYNSVKQIILLTLICSLAVGCKSTTVIHSKPEGAKLFMENIYVGNTPYTHKDKKIVGTKTPLRLTMDGFDPLETNLCRDEEIDLVAVAGGCYLLFPFLWVEGYHPEHTYVLTPIAQPTSLK